MTKMKPVRKAVFPVAGLGTRFLPATKAMPKEMLPVVDKPLIQYAVEEAAAAGITDMIFITVVPPGINFIFIRQPEPLGLGHAVLCAQPVVGEEPFAVLLADDLIDAKQPAIAQLIKAREENDGGNVLAVQTVPRELTKQYGIVEVNGEHEKCPTMAVIGRYVLEPEIFDSLRKIDRGAGGEIQLTDAIAREIPKGKTIACKYDGERFDCGSKQGFLNATVHYARKEGYRII